ncbi:hypothetical protein F3J09_04845 [Bacillus sp. Ab-1751]|nr:hypothetical protein [Bacillus sp. Ab-1751]PFB19298.1 hypothetical protein CN408_16515 [Bacillus cereus]PGA24858.1 hypothetical protein COL80_17145 [Bacillus thuringiensis]
MIGFIKNAILSVYFYKKNSAFFVLWIQIYLSLIAISVTSMCIHGLFHTVYLKGIISIKSGLLIFWFRLTAPL